MKAINVVYWDVVKEHYDWNEIIIEMNFTDLIIDGQMEKYEYDGQYNLKEIEQ